MRYTAVRGPCAPPSYRDSNCANKRGGGGPSPLTKVSCGSKVNIKVFSTHFPLHMPESSTFDSAEPLSETQLRSFIARHLPAWQQACDAEDGDSIVLHEASFGTSTHELLLFACAIKYAATKGKHVHVVSGTGITKHELEAVLRPAALGSVFREMPVGRRRRRSPDAKAKSAMRKKNNSRRGY